MKTESALALLGLALAAGPVQAADKWDITKIDAGKLPPAAATKGVTYDKDIRPLFEASCFRCHGEERQKGELRLDSLQAVLKGGEDGKVLVAGDSKKSLLVAAVAQINDEIAMPPKRRPGGGGPGGPGGQGGPPNRPPGAPGDQRNAQGQPGGPDGGNPPPGGPGGRRGGGPGGFGGGGFGPPPKPLTVEQVGLIRAWIDQGAR